MSPARVLEIFVYELVDLIPSLFLACIPFQDHLRFSRRITAAISVMLYILLTSSRIIVLEDERMASLFNVLWILLYLGFYWLCIRAEKVKLLFVLLIILNYQSFVTILLGHFVYYRLASEPYSFQAVLAMLCILSLSYPFLFFMMKRRIKPLVYCTENNRMWNSLWLVPGLSCISYYYSLYASGGVITFVEKLDNVLFASVLNITSLFVTYIVARLVEQSNTYQYLKAENYQLNMQFMQYENLKSRIGEARRAKHDLRQNMMVIRSYLQHDDKKGLQEYLHQYWMDIPFDTTISYCENAALNALLVYYGDMAKVRNISFEVKLCDWQEVNVTDSDTVVIFGNLLENAIEACTRQKGGERFVRLHVGNIDGKIIITVDNSYDGLIRKTESNFLSSKGEREGIGIQSIQKIAQKYGGIAQFQYNGAIFCVSVLLYSGNNAQVLKGSS